MDLVVEIVTDNVSFERWRELYHSEELNRLIATHTKIRERRVLEHVTLPDGRERRTLRVVPDVDVPRVARGLLGGREVAYNEITVYDSKTRTARLDIETEASDSLRISGAISYVVTDKAVRMRFTGQVKVDVFGVGALVERFIAAEVKNRYAIIERLMQELADRAP